MNNQKTLRSIVLSAMLLMGAGTFSSLPQLFVPVTATAATSRPQMNVPYTVTPFNFVAWQNSAIPSTVFLSNATSAEITVKGAVYVAFSKARDAWNYTDIDGGTFNWNEANKSGVTFTATGEVLELAKKGGLYVRTNASDGLTLIVKNVGAGGGSNEPVIDDPTPDPEPEEVTDYNVNLYEWSDIPIAGLAFGQNATAARLTVTNACYVRISHKVNGQLVTVAGGEFSWSDGNRKGVTYDLTGDLLAEAKQGKLCIYVGGANGKTITLNVASTGAETPTEPDPEPEVTPDPEPETPVTPDPEPETPAEPDPEPEVTPDPEPETPVTPDPEPETPAEPDPEPEVTPDPEPETPVTPDPEPETPAEPDPEPEVTPDPEPETPVTPDPEPETPAEPSDSYGVISRNTRTLSEWQDIQLTASLFDTNADKAKVTVSGACYVKFSHRVNGSMVTLDKGEYQWNDNNKGGVHYELTGSLLNEALRGYVYVWVGGGNPINLLVTNYGQGGTPEEAGGDVPEGIDANDMFDPTARAYAIANRRQLTNVPTFYFTIPDAEGKDVNTVLYKDRATNTAEYHAATLQVVDGSEDGLTEFTDELEMKVRGNSTADCVKKPYRLKFPKGHKQDLLGAGYTKRNWTLLANYLDPSLIRNALTYHIGQLAGMDFCPGYKFVDVVMNNEYRGIYQVSDHIEVGKNRINEDENTAWYVEVSRGDMVEEPCIYAGGMAMSIKNPEPETAAEIQALKNEVSAWFTAAQKVFFSSDFATFTDPDKGWRAYFDEESFANYYIAVNITGDYDGYMTVKMSRDMKNQGKMKLAALWDKDLAFGNFTADNGTTLVEQMNNGQFGYYVQKVLTDPAFVKLVYNKVHALQRNGLEQQIQNYIDELSAGIALSEELNQTRWPGHSSWIHNFSTYGDAVQQLKDYERAHIPFFIGEVDKLYTKAGGRAAVRDEATAISAVVAQGEEVQVRTLSGAVVGHMTSDAISELPAGIYIIAGQKVVIR